MKIKALVLPALSVVLAIPAIITSNTNVGALNPFKDEAGNASSALFEKENAPINHLKKNMSASAVAPVIGNRFGIQVSEVQNGKRSVRFIAEINTLNCSASFNRTIYSLGEDNKVSADDSAYKTTSTVTCDCAYTSVANGAKTYTPASGNYLIVYTMNNVPEAYWGYYFDLSVTLTYLDANEEEQTITSSSHKANIYGGLYSDNFVNSSSTCTLFESSSISGSTTPTAILRRDENYPAVIVKEAYTQEASDNVSALSFGKDVTKVGNVAFSSKSGSESAPNGTGSDYANYESPYEGVTSVDFGNTSVTIGNYAFAGCESLTEISFPLAANGLPTCGTIGYGAFAGSSIEFMDIPDSTGVEAYSFGGCPKLKEVVIHNECLCDNEFADDPVLEKVTFAEDIKYANPVGYFQWISGMNGIYDTKKNNQDIRSFKNSPSLKEVYVYCDTKYQLPQIWSINFNDMKKLETFVITGKSYLSPNMFNGCTALKTVSITTNMYGIQANAFKDCGASLTLNFDGTLAQWNSLSKGSNWYVGANITVVASDGTTSYQGL